MYRFTRDFLNRLLGGVCSGLGAQIGVSAWWVRLAFVVLALSNWLVAALIYLLLWVLMPDQGLNDMPHFTPIGQEPAVRYTRAEPTFLIGVLTIVVGALVLMQGAGYFRVGQGDMLAPVLTLLLGVTVLFKHIRGRA